MELHPFSPCPVDSPDKCPLESRPVMDIAVFPAPCWQRHTPRYVVLSAAIL